MNPGMTFGANSCSKENEILGDGCVQNEHGSHGTASIVVYPFVIVEVIDETRVRLLDLGSELVHYGGSISIGMVGDNLLTQVLQNVNVEFVVCWKPGVEKSGHGGEHHHEGGNSVDPLHDGFGTVEICTIYTNPCSRKRRYDGDRVYGKRVIGLM